jgi:predicted nucleotidyltransferase component of viral defense system
LKILNNLQDIEALYLTGGTALSLYLKHRKSFDIDLFTASEELILPFSNNLEKVLKENGLDTKRTKTFHTFTEFVVTEEDTTTVIQIAPDFPYKLSEPVIFEDFSNLKIDSFIDISANKLLALLVRSEPRDFIDVYFVIKSGKLSREQLIESTKKKDTGFDLY